MPGQWLATRGTRLVLVALALAGCSSGTAPEPVVPAGPATTAAPATSAPPPSPGTDRVIAAAALLQPADLGGSTLEPLARGQFEHLRPARPCGARYPADAGRTAAVAMRAQVSRGEGRTPTIVLQYVGRHPGAAERAFDEVVAAVERCPGGTGPGERRWRTAAGGIAGDESVLLRVSETVDYGDRDVVTTTPAVVVRVGDYVTVVADLGWEASGGDEAYARELAVKAADRLRAG